MKFTEKQIEAIHHFKGPALVLAVPGSGKTTVLLNRILFLIENGINPQNILSITFSKAQGLDMENRFNRTNDKYKGKVHFKTIHAFCYEILRTYFKAKNIKKTLIEGSSDFNRSLVVKRAFFTTYGEKLRDEIVSDFFTIYDYTQNKMLDFEDFIKSNKLISNRQTMCKLFKIYTKLKERNNYIDFNDLLILANEYISTDIELLKYIKKKYKYFQVDEGQDTSTLQFEIIRKIVYPENNLFVVADDDQSIYSFRGASPENLLNFENFYPNSKIIFMDKNFRSNNDIIQISNNIIKLNKNRYDKEIQFESAEKQNCIRLVNTKNSKIQYRELLKKIKEISADETIGVLYRNNISSIPLANLFLENDVDFFVKDSKLEFFNNTILKDIKDILIFAEDTTNIDAFYRIYFKLNAYLKREFLNVLQYKNYSDDVFDPMLDIENLNSFYFSKISKLRNDFKKIKRLKLKEKIKYIYEELGYGEYLQNLHDDSTLNYNLILDIVLNLCENLEHTEEFFEKIESIKEKIENAKNSRSKIAISTIHSSKGLEYDNVFVVDLVANEFPLKSSFEMSKLHIEEERRLFYVAITRAKKKLFLFTMKNRNGIEVKHSKFYEEIKKSNSI